MFYLYAYVRPDTGLIFYVGKGQGRRALSLRQRNRYFTFVVEKLRRNGLRPVCCIIREGLTEVEAFLHETILIGQLRALGVPLCNITDGGEGNVGLKHTSETLERISVTSKGRKHTEAARLKVSAAQRGIKKSIEHRAKLSAAKKGKKLTSEHRAKLVAVLMRSPMTTERSHAMHLAKKMKKHQEVGI